MQEVIQEFKTVKEMVQECLAENPSCRDNDLWLIINVWQKKQGMKIFIPYDKVGELASP